MRQAHLVAIKAVLSSQCGKLARDPPSVLEKVGRISLIKEVPMPLGVLTERGEREGLGWDG